MGLRLLDAVLLIDPRLKPPNGLTAAHKQEEMGLKRHAADAASHGGKLGVSSLALTAA